MDIDFGQLEKDFKENLANFIIKSDELKKNQLHRVSKKLAGFPLEEELITLIHKEEKEVYEIGVQLHSIKLNLMVESLKLDAEEERIKANEEQRKAREQNSIPANTEIITRQSCSITEAPLTLRYVNKGSLGSPAIFCGCNNKIQQSSSSLQIS